MHGAVIDSFFEWFGRNNLQLIVAKTKGMMVNFRRSMSSYLGVHLDIRLTDWGGHGTGTEPTLLSEEAQVHPCM